MSSSGGTLVGFLKRAFSSKSLKKDLAHTESSGRQRSPTSKARRRKSSGSTSSSSASGPASESAASSSGSGDAPAAVAEGEWERAYDERSGSYYWYNAATGQSQWDNTDVAADGQVADGEQGDDAVSAALHAAKLAVAEEEFAGTAGAYGSPEGKGDDPERAQGQGGVGNASANSATRSRAGEDAHHGSGKMASTDDGKPLPRARSMGHMGRGSGMGQDAAAGPMRSSASVGGSADDLYFAGRPWQRLFDESAGRHYYFNKETGEAQWEEPGGSAEVEHPSGGLKRIGSWLRRMDENSGHEYYVNEETGDSQWERPQDFDEAYNSSAHARAMLNHQDSDNADADAADARAPAVGRSTGHADDEEDEVWEYEVDESVVPGARDASPSPSSKADTASAAKSERAARARRVLAQNDAVRDWVRYAQTHGKRVAQDKEWEVWNTPRGAVFINTITNKGQRNAPLRLQQQYRGGGVGDAGRLSHPTAAGKSATPTEKQQSPRPDASSAAVHAARAAGVDGSLQALKDLRKQRQVLKNMNASVSQQADWSHPQSIPLGAGRSPPPAAAPRAPYFDHEGGDATTSLLHSIEKQQLEKQQGAPEAGEMYDPVTARFRNIYTSLKDRDRAAIGEIQQQDDPTTAADTRQSSPPRGNGSPIDAGNDTMRTVSPILSPTKRDNRSMSTKIGDRSSKPDHRVPSVSPLGWSPSHIVPGAAESFGGGAPHEDGALMGDKSVETGEEEEKEGHDSDEEGEDGEHDDGDKDEDVTEGDDEHDFEDEDSEAARRRELGELQARVLMATRGADEDTGGKDALADDDDGMSHESAPDVHVMAARAVVVRQRWPWSQLLDVRSKQTFYRNDKRGYFQWHCPQVLKSQDADGTARDNAGAQDSDDLRHRETPASRSIAGAAGESVSVVTTPPSRDKLVGTAQQGSPTTPADEMYRRRVHAAESAKQSGHEQNRPGELGGTRRVLYQDQGEDSQQKHQHDTGPHGSAGTARQVEFDMDRALAAPFPSIHEGGGDDTLSAASDTEREHGDVHYSPNKRRARYGARDHTATATPSGALLFQKRRLRNAVEHLARRTMLQHMPPDRVELGLQQLMPPETAYEGRDGHIDGEGQMLSASDPEGVDMRCAAGGGGPLWHPGRPHVTSDKVTKSKSISEVIPEAATNAGAPPFADTDINDVQQSDDMLPGSPERQPADMFSTQLSPVRASISQMIQRSKLRQPQRVEAQEQSHEEQAADRRHNGQFDSKQPGYDASVDMHMMQPGVNGSRRAPPLANIKRWLHNASFAADEGHEYRTGLGDWGTGPHYQCYDGILGLGGDRGGYGEEEVGGEPPPVDNQVFRAVRQIRRNRKRNKRDFVLPAGRRELVSYFGDAPQDDDSFERDLERGKTEVNLGQLEERTTTQRVERARRRRDAREVAGALHYMETMLPVPGEADFIGSGLRAQREMRVVQLQQMLSYNTLGYSSSWCQDLGNAQHLHEQDATGGGGTRGDGGDHMGGEPPQEQGGGRGPAAWRPSAEECHQCIVVAHVEEAGHHYDVSRFPCVLERTFGDWVQVRVVVTSKCWWYNTRTQMVQPGTPTAVRFSQAWKREELHPVGRATPSSALHGHDSSIVQQEAPTIHGAHLPSYVHLHDTSVAARGQTQRSHTGLGHSYSHQTTGGTGTGETGGDGGRHTGRVLIDEQQGPITIHMQNNEFWYLPALDPGRDRVPRIDLAPQSFQTSTQLQVRRICTENGHQDMAGMLGTASLPHASALLRHDGSVDEGMDDNESLNSQEMMQQVLLDQLFSMEPMSNGIVLDAPAQHAPQHGATGGVTGAGAATGAVTLGGGSGRRAVSSSAGATRTTSASGSGRRRSNRDKGGAPSKALTAASSGSASSSGAAGQERTDRPHSRSRSRSRAQSSRGHRRRERESSADEIASGGVAIASNEGAPAADSNEHALDAKLQWFIRQLRTHPTYVPLLLQFANHLLHIREIQPAVDVLARVLEIQHAAKAANRWPMTLDYEAMVHTVLARIHALILRDPVQCIYHIASAVELVHGIRRPAFRASLCARTALLSWTLGEPALAEVLLLAGLHSQAEHVPCLVHLARLKLQRDETRAPTVLAEHGSEVSDEDETDIGGNMCIDGTRPTHLSADRKEELQTAIRCARKALRSGEDSDTGERGSGGQSSPLPKELKSILCAMIGAALELSRAPDEGIEAMYKHSTDTQSGSRLTDTGTPEAFCGLAYHCHMRGRVNEATALYQRSLKRDSQFAHSLTMYAALLSTYGADTQLTDALFRRALFSGEGHSHAHTHAHASSPAAWYRYMSLAEFAEARLGDWDLAEQALVQAAELCPSSVAVCGLVNFWWRTGRASGPRQSRTILKEATERWPRSPELRTVAGYWLLNLALAPQAVLGAGHAGRRHRMRASSSGIAIALQEFNRALELSPSYGPALRGQSICLWELHHVDAAFHCIGLADAADPTNPCVMRTQGLMFVTQARVAEYSRGNSRRRGGSGGGGSVGGDVGCPLPVRSPGRGLYTPARGRPPRPESHARRTRIISSTFGNVRPDDYSESSASASLSPSTEIGASPPSQHKGQGSAVGHAERQEHEPVVVALAMHEDVEFVQPSQSQTAAGSGGRAAAKSAAELWSAARQVLRRACEAVPFNTRGLLGLALVEYYGGNDGEEGANASGDPSRSNRLQNAISLLKQALTAEQVSGGLLLAPVSILMGQLSLEVENPLVAEKHFNVALRCGGSESLAMCGLASSLWQQQVMRLLKRLPSGPPVQSDATGAEMDERIQTLFERAVACREAPPTVLFQYGRWAAWHGLYDVAKDAFQQASSSATHLPHCVALYMLGRLFLREGDTSRAESCFVAAVECEPVMLSHFAKLVQLVADDHATASAVHEYHNTFSDGDPGVDSARLAAESAISASDGAQGPHESRKTRKRRLKAKAKLRRSRTKRARVLALRGGLPLLPDRDHRAVDPLTSSLAARNEYSLFERTLRFALLRARKLGLDWAKLKTLSALDQHVVLDPLWPQAILRSFYEPEDWGTLLHASNLIALQRQRDIEAEATNLGL